jgi:hypothetical protein
LILTFSWRNEIPSPVSTSVPCIIHDWTHHQYQPVHREFFMFGPITSLNRYTVNSSCLDPSPVSTTAQKLKIEKHELH